MRLLALTLLTTLFLTGADAGFAKLHHRAPATRTESAVRSRQLTRERLVMRSEKLTMASLFGRADCSLPEPSTLACTCGPEYELCGSFCRNTDGDPDFCGSCGNECPPGTPGERGCCSGSCTNFAIDEANCGSCGTSCDIANGDECCSGSCSDLSANPEHCGACGTTCDTAGGETCCSGTCIPPDGFQQNDANCGACGIACTGIGETCCGGICVPTSVFVDDNLNCGACGNVCGPGLNCCDNTCVNLGSDPNNCGDCGSFCVGTCFFGICST